MDKVIEITLVMIALVVGIVRVMQIKLFCKSVEGRCIEVSIRNIYPGNLFGIKSLSTYEYQYEGKNYVFKEKSYVGSKRRKEGKIYKLYVNPKNPEKCLTPTFVELTWDCFIIAALVLVLLLL